MMDGGGGRLHLSVGSVGGTASERASLNHGRVHHSVRADPTGDAHDANHGETPGS